MTVAANPTCRHAVSPATRIAEQQATLALALAPGRNRTSIRLHAESCGVVLRVSFPTIHLAFGNKRASAVLIGQLGTCLHIVNCSDPKSGQRKKKEETEIATIAQYTVRSAHVAQDDHDVQCLFLKNDDYRRRRKMEKEEMRASRDQSLHSSNKRGYFQYAVRSTQASHERRCARNQRIAHYKEEATVKGTRHAICLPDNHTSI